MHLFLYKTSDICRFYKANIVFTFGWLLVEDLGDPIFEVARREIVEIFERVVIKPQFQLRHVVQLFFLAVLKKTLLRAVDHKNI